ncbi:MAG: hypothetical protein COA53_06215 [Rhodobacteraceae bacterium]|nr:MAG: hypothetical protein COA53_06215 [Paracoccaceae bacterium]
MFRKILLTLMLSAITLPAFAQSSSLIRGWPDTDFTNTSVDLGGIMSGGPGKDGIPALSSVDLVPVVDVEFSEREPVLTVEMDGVAPRAYPIRYLTWHEIANDVIGDVPVAVTFCPLCNSALVFDRRLDGQVLDFGVSGNLMASNMVMFDRQTESWWLQFTGEGIVGDMTGKQLTQVVSWMESLGEFRARNPNGEVMDQPTNFRRQYGANPYAGYDQSAQPFLYRGENPPFGISPLARVVTVGNRAWPLERLSEAEEITEAGVRIVWKSGMASALGARRISDARDIGSIRVFDAVTGEDVIHDVAFAFAFHAFEPDGEWMLGN